MRDAITVARWEFRRTTGRKAYIFMTALIPALFVLGVLAISIIKPRADARSSTSDKPLGYVDLAGIIPPTAVAPPLLKAYKSEEGARADVEGGRLEGYFVIEPGYMATGMVRLVTPELGAFGRRAREVEPLVRYLLLNALIGPATDPAVANRIRDPVLLNSRDLAGKGFEGEAGEVAGFMVPYGIALLIVMAIFISSGYLLQGVGEEKESRVIEIVLSAISPTDLFAGKVAGQAVAGLVQILVWFASAVALLPVLLAQVGDIGDLTVGPLVYVAGALYFLLGYLVMAAFYAGIAAIAPTVREGQSIAGVSALMVALPLVLTQPIIEHPDSGLALTLSLIPFTAPTAGLLRIAAGSTSLASIVASLAVLAASVPFLLWVSSRIFRIGLLVYGRRLRLRDVIRGIRLA